MDNCKNNKIKTYPVSISLHDNRCFHGYCEKCEKTTYYCEHMKKYICCKCCENKDVKK